ncbi:hypothetical protein ACFVU0_34615 [Streptomyces sp. NPDC058122]|uniref:hypothetical protein n=1 Tax=Streptomyces sp. NPDC058122 TaxID=3346349 RepID=UPI0036E6AC44
MSHHAVEITLTRPVTPGELRDARRSMPLAASADRTRLMTVHSARSPGGALHAVRRRLGTRVPVDVLATHYPDQHGHVLVNVDLHRSADKALHQAAAVLGQRPQDLLRRRVTAALARDAQERARHLELRLESLLANHAPEEVLACVAGFLHSRRHLPTHSAS